MLKTLKFFLYLNLFLVLLIIIVACVLQSIDYYALSPFWQGARHAIFNGVESISDYELGVYLGQLILPLVLPILGLIVIKKRSYKFSVIITILFGLFTIASLGNSKPYLLGIIIFILFLTKSVRSYFKIKNEKEF